MEYRIVDGKQVMDAEPEELHRRELEAKERVRQEAGALIRKLEQTYDALGALMRQNPELRRQAGEAGADEGAYQKLRRGLAQADEAPRCRWVKQDGTTCRSPQIRKHIYCYAHKQMMEARALALCLPALEDPNAIQISLMRIQKALIDDTITAKKAGLLLYSLQLGITNIGQTTFGEADERELATDLVDEQDALRQELGLPLIHTDEADRTNLPRMNADDRGSEAQVRRDEIGRSGHREIGRSALPLINAAGRGFEAGVGWDQPTPKWDAMG